MFYLLHVLFPRISTHSSVYARHAMKMGNCLHHQGYTVTHSGRLEPNDICSDSNKSDFMGSKGYRISDIMDTEDDAFMDNI